MELHAAVQRGDVLVHVMMEMKLGDSKLSERNQSLHTARLHLNEAEAESRLLVLGAGGGAE